MTVVVNFFGGPGSGKSSLTGGLFYNLKTKHLIRSEMAREVAKVLVWDGRHKMLQNQSLVTALQKQEIDIVHDHVDVVVCDSPILLGSIYAPKNYPQSYHDFLFWQYQQYDNINIVVNRNKPFDPNGRMHNEQEAADAHKEIIQLLTKYGLMWFETTSDGLDEVTEYVVEQVKVRQKAARGPYIWIDWLSELDYVRARETIPDQASEYGTS